MTAACDGANLLVSHLMTLAAPLVSKSSMNSVMASLPFVQNLITLNPGHKKKAHL